MSIEGIYLEHFSTTYQKTSSSYLFSRKRNAVFHSFMYDHIKQDSAITAAHRKLIIEMLKNINL